MTNSHRFNRILNSSDSSIYANTLGQKDSPSTQLWWENFKIVKTFLDENGSYQNINKELKLWANWANSNRQKKRILPKDMRQALEDIHFPFNTPIPQKTGSRQEEALSLAKEWEQGPLTMEKMEKLRKERKYYQNSYDQGQLNKERAEKLYLNLDIS